ncbi:MAG: hypothetical protein KY469_08680 [Actinobacteria bacterium]|nr:hypothetical protein [Actinomycetota bacterium]
MTTGTETGSRTDHKAAAESKLWTIVAIVAAIAFALAGMVYRAGGDDEGDPTGDAAAPIADGDHHGYVRVIDDGGIEVDLVEVLTGEEAADAAHEDGVLEPSEPSMPNDVYIRNAETKWVEVDRAADASLALYDCTTTCQPIAADWGAFLGGTASAYNGDLAVYELTVADGEISELAEIYLP